jgi:Flp pilus assembly CpaF family ATPase
MPEPRSSAAKSLDRRIQMLRTAMGPLIAAALEDPDVVEIMLNPDRTLWIDRLSSGRAPMGVELSEADGERIIRLVAAHVGAEVHRGQPLLSAELPETGERFEGILPPAAPGPAFALRKRAIGVIPLERYVADGMMTARPGRLPHPRGARAAEHPDRGGHEQRQDHAGQCAAGRDRRHGRPRAGARRHGGAAMRGP